VLPKLEDLFEAQLAFQERLGHDLPAMTPDTRLRYIRDCTLACVSELMEALDETGWKPWATSRHVHEDKFFAELRDAWQFLTNLMFAARPDLGPAGLAELLEISLYQKLEINHARAATGYDGVSGKCEACHRALDDASVDCAGPADACGEREIIVVR